MIDNQQLLEAVRMLIEQESDKLISKQPSTTIYRAVLLGLAAISSIGLVAAWATLDDHNDKRYWRREEQLTRAKEIEAKFDTNDRLLRQQLESLAAGQNDLKEYLRSMNRNK